MNEYRRPHSIFFPILLVTLGIFLLMANLGTIQNSAWGILETYWPLIFIIGALDGLYQRHGWVGPLVGIGLGTVLLLGNLHYLQWDSLDLLLRLWPVLLVAWGLDIAFGNDNLVWNTLVRVGLGLLLARVISRPLQRLTNAAARLAEGDLVVESLLPAASRDEIGMLSTSFRRMVGYQQEMVEAALEYAAAVIDEEQVLAHA